VTSRAPTRKLLADMPLPADVLRGVRTIVTHDHCSDGLASALILKTALPEASILFVQYGTPELLGLRAEPGMLFCDMSPPADRANEFVAARAVVLDHHATARSVVEAFGERGVFGDEKTEPGVSGAVLALRAVGADASGPVVRELATLAGIRDTWQRTSPRWNEAIAQHEALMFWPRAKWLDAPVADWPRLLEIGPTLLEKQAERVQRAIDKAWRFVLGGVRLVVLDRVELTSDVAETLHSSVDLVVGFGYRAEEGSKLTLAFSMRSHTDFDCAAFAKHEGGGGHTRAAGFSMPCAPFEDASPYRVFRDRLERWLATRAERTG
jgi:hypothetical protein